jgi:hypothetical protein
MTASSTLTVSGTVTFYVSGKLTLNGQVITTSKNPGDLTFQVTGGQQVSIGSGVQLYAHINAPYSDISTGGNSNIYGWMMGNTLTLGGGSNLHYDGSLDNNAKPYIIQLVQ